MDTFNMKDAVKTRYNVLDYVNKHIIPSVRYKGSNRLLEEKTPIICPFHNETNPSFWYYSERNRFKCFGCNVGGDVIDLHRYWSAKNGRYINFKQAVVELYYELETNHW